MRHNWLLLYVFLCIINATENRPTVGLVLSGGGARGFSHVGVIQVIDSLQIPIDYIAATSMGAIAGALYAIGYSADELYQMGYDTDWESVLTDSPKRKFLPYFRKKESGMYQLKFGLDGFKPVAPTGMIHGQNAFMELSRLVGKHEQIIDYDNLAIPFRCIATDLITGNEVLMNSGSLTKAIRSSLSIPSIFSPVPMGDSLLIDGGVVNNLPIDVAKKMGADIIIAIDVSTPTKQSKHIKNVIDVLNQSISVHEIKKGNQNALLADLVIKPDLSNYRSIDFDHQSFIGMVKQGVKAGYNYIDELIEIKNRLNGSHKKIHKDKILSHPKIKKIQFKGNQTFSDEFLHRLLGFEQNQELDIEHLHHNITEMYGLGYFKTIQYELIPLDNQSIILQINIEEDAQRMLKTGLRWDDRLGLVGIINLTFYDKWLHGFIIENQSQYAGKRTNLLNIYYPSRNLDFPIYPFARWYLQESTINNISNKFEFYRNQFGLGIGFILTNFWAMEFEYQNGNIYIDDSSDNHNEYNIDRSVSSLHFNATLDLLDEVLIPHSGILININHEKSDTLIHSDSQYSWYSISTDAYWTINRHTIRLFSYWHQGYNDVPLHLQNYNFSAQTFSGIQYGHLTGNKLTIGRIEYRFKFKHDILLHTIINSALMSKPDDPNSQTAFLGGGFGITLTSFAGPLEFIFAWGPEDVLNPHSYQFQSYFNFGYKF